MPKVSFVIPVLNAERTLNEALDSLTKQDFTNFDVILINDGSNDATEKIAQSYSNQLDLQLINHQTPQGIADSLNEGIKVSQAEFIARLDADDIAEPSRLSKQVEFLNQNPTIGICGTDMLVFSDGVTKGILAHPTSSNKIRTALVQRCAISHPSVMCRKQIFETIGYYNNQFEVAQDYELWCRASLLGIQFANIPEPLTRYRKHADQAGQKKAQLQYERDLEIKKRYISAWLNGENPGLLPHFFSLVTKFPSEEVGLQAFNQVALMMMQLAKVLPDTEEYTSIVAGSVARHLN